MFTRTHAQASPSVTVEKGLARLRPVRPNPPSTKLREQGQRGSPFPTDTERRAAAILASIALVVLLVVCVALYVLSRSSRWELLTLPLSTHSELQLGLDDQLLTPLPAPRAEGTKVLVSELWDSSRRYLSYLPHSGFHNQRIALENALVLASILNRTLLIPPIRLGDPPLRYRSSSSLRTDVALSTHIGLEHCNCVPQSAPLPEECTDFCSHTHVPWDWLVELPRIVRKHGIRTLPRWDLGDAFLARLRLAPADTYFLNDTDPYQFRFFDSSADAAPLGPRYHTRIDLPDLAALSREHRLLQFGTLFGTTRVRLVDPAHVALRKDVRRAMVFANEKLLRVAGGVRDSLELGGLWGYAGVHLRLGDGVFADAGARARNVRHVWWRLVRELGVSDEDAVKVEARAVKGKRVTPPVQVRDVAALRVPHPVPLPLPPSRKSTCQFRASHPLLNIPLYIATDKPRHPMLSLFTQTFPCVYFLSNFSGHVARLDMISAPSTTDRQTDADADYPLDTHGARTPRDEAALAPFLPPFLDAIVAAQARVVVGTPGSTFSRFVEDVLWRAYHGWEIVQRG